MTTATRSLTADDLWDLPEHGGHCELVRGELRPMSPAGFEHGIVTTNLSGPLSVFVRQQGLGVVTAAETGFLIARDPDTVRAPDAGFVRKDRLTPGVRPQKFWIGAPDLAIETISPTDTVVEVDQKVQEWLVAGCALVWILNPRQKTATVYRADRSVQVLSVTDMLDGEQVIPGFAYPVAQIFD